MNDSMLERNYKILKVVSVAAFSFFLVLLTIVIFNSVPVNSPKNEFSIITTYENQDFENELVNYGKKNKINVKITYAGDLEIIQKLNSGEEYDAVWISNSIWLYMLNSDVSIKNSKSISINPVVFGIKKSVAKELGFVDNKVYNKDIINVIRDKKLKYVMPSVTKTNAGATAYLGFLKVLSNSDGILTIDALENETLQDDLKALFSGVERVSGTEDFLENIFLNSDEYEAVVSSETSLIRINKQLVDKNKEPLYLIYPEDGVAISDFPFAYIDRGQKKENKFEVIQKYLLSKEGTEKLEKLGRRVWYGGTNNKSDKNVFNPEWGINTNKYLMSLRYPSKTVINKAFSLYVDVLRKPSIVVFCLDFSGSMYGDGITQLRNAMNYILDYEQASKDFIQFTSRDMVYVIPFNGTLFSGIVGGQFNDYNKNKILSTINELNPNGETNIYTPTVEALKLIKNIQGDDYTKTVILMTDGYSNIGSFQELKSFYNTNHLNVPIYSIMFGSPSEQQLLEISSLTNAKIFNGIYNLKEAFKEVRSFN